ncbi:MAG TPA: hypothetical protein VG737_04375, partial [Cyclobacteriaceae bacterium]|nr:hypothetical protein [Cyclobacteriaceae bacterium]
MEEQPAHQDADRGIAEAPVDPPKPILPVRPARRFSLRRFNQRITLIISVLLKAAGIVVVILLSTVIFRQLRFDGYTLQAVHVPEAFERDGHGGSAIAAGIEAQLKKIKTTVETYDQWDINDGIEVGDYSVAESGSELEVNLVGVGFSIRSVVNLVGASLGIERNK